MPAPTSTTLIDLVDQNDQPIGTIRRQDVFQRHAGFRVVHVLVFNSRGEILLQQVGHMRDRSPLLWGSSVAGYLFSGENYFDAATRRLREEIGLETELYPIGNATMDDLGATKFIHVFRTNSDAARNLEPELIETLRYFDIAEIEQMLADEPQQFTDTFPIVFGLLGASATR